MTNLDDQHEDLPVTNLVQDAMVADANPVVGAFPANFVDPGGLGFAASARIA